MPQTYHLTITVNYADGTEETEEYSGLTMKEVNHKLNVILSVSTVTSLVSVIAKQ